MVLAITGFSHTAAQAKSDGAVYSMNGLISVAKFQQNSTKFVQQRTQRIRLAQSSGRRISPSAALRAAKRVAPGSKGLGVRFLPARRGYVVTLKTRGRVRRVFVDAKTGRVGR